MQKYLTMLRVFEKNLSMFFMFLIVALVFGASLLRTLGYPLIWSIDIAQLLFVWVCFLGADIALQQDKHIGVDILTRFFPEKFNRIVTICSYAMIFGFLAIVIVFGTHLALNNSHRQFNTMTISYSWVTMSAPVGCLLLAITVIEKMIGLLKPAKSVASDALSSRKGETQ